MSETTVKPATRQFSAEVSRVLHLMIHSLYTNKDIFLRELISNASDACDKLRYLSLSDQSLREGGSELAITLRVDEAAGILEVADNGIGMNEADLIANLGTIARSGTREFVAGLDQGAEAGAQIGQFGVGFYSSFMVADRVEVFSRKAGEAESWQWRSAGLGEYEVEPAAEDQPRGTRVRLHLRAEAKEYLDRFRLGHVVSTYSDHIAFPIRFESGEESETLNEGSALWTRPKAEISDEQYREFYHHVAHSPDTPFLTLHNSVEGKTSYTNLLFIPSLKPFDLFHPERRRRVKLYVRRVFITDENVEIVPPYLRFLRGIVDSQDLPLNISRETLQDNPLLKTIRDSVTSRVLTELARKAGTDPESFAKFWEQFGAVVKEGLCEASSPRDKLLEVCRFTSTMHEMTSLTDYVARMKDGQEDIFYLSGDSLGAVRNNPLLEGFAARGIEVLLLTDHVDDFWLNVVRDFGGKPFKSITRAGIDLDKLGEADARADAAPVPAGEGIDALIARLRDVYGEAVKDVRTTTKLDSSPACLAVAEGDLDMRMERFLMEHRQLPAKSARILELNPRHPLIVGMASRLADKSDDEVRDAAHLLLDQAKIVEGETVDDPAETARRMSRMMERFFAA